MTTLPQLTLDFNRKIKLSNDGGELSSDTGEFLVPGTCRMRLRIEEQNPSYGE